MKTYDPGEAIAIVSRLRTFLADNEMYSIRDVARSTRISEDTLYQWLNVGRKPQARMLAYLQELEKYLNRKEAKQ